MGSTALGSRTAYGWAAFAWAALFALQSWYGAAGGRFGIETFGPAVTEPALRGDQAFLATLWLIGAAKLALGVLALVVALAMGPPWVRQGSRRAVLWVGWLCVAYGAANLVQHGLMALGVLEVPEGLGRTAMWWHLALWDPWWMLGGVLLVLTARAARPARAARATGPATAPDGRPGRARRRARTPSPPPSAAR